MKKNKSLINHVERASADLRRGQIVVVKSADSKDIAILSPENIHPAIYKELCGFGPMSLIITKRRVGILNKKLAAKSGQLLKLAITEKLDKQLLKEISGIDSTLKDLDILLKKGKISNDKTEIAAIKLAKIAELIPSLVIAKIKNAEKFARKYDLLMVAEKYINKFEPSYSNQLTEVSNAPLKLENAPHARIISFRPESGSKEHHAIIIGKIDTKKAVPVRIHSSCYTGDLLSSLRCDCRDQLHAAINHFGKIKSGIVLYLMQEGRGIGLINKLRAYELQYEDGLDTVDANEFLGFEPDERPFDLASAILKKLGIKKIELMTNNPRKIKEMENQGIRVEKRIILCPKKHEFVHEYLKTKSVRLNHMIKI